MNICVYKSFLKRDRKIMLVVENSGFLAVDSLLRARETIEVAMAQP